MSSEDTDSISECDITAMPSCEKLTEIFRQWRQLFPEEFLAHCRTIGENGTVTLTFDDDSYLTGAQQEFLEELWYCCYCPDFAAVFAAGLGYASMNMNGSYDSMWFEPLTNARSYTYVSSPYTHW